MAGPSGHIGRRPPAGSGTARPTAAPARRPGRGRIAGLDLACLPDEVAGVVVAGRERPGVLRLRDHDRLAVARGEIVDVVTHRCERAVEERDCPRSTVRVPVHSLEHQLVDAVPSIAFPAGSPVWEVEAEAVPRWRSNGDRLRPRRALLRTQRVTQGPTPPIRSTAMWVMYPGGGLSIGGNFTSGPK